jgi:hypothetical protein
MPVQSAKEVIDRQIRSLVLCVDLVGSRRIWPAQVGCLVDLDGSSRVPSDRLDDQPDDQARQAVRRTEILEDRGVHMPKGIDGQWPLFAVTAM